MITFAVVDIGVGGVAPCVLCARGGSADVVKPHALEKVALSIAVALPQDSRPEVGGVAFDGFEPFSHPELPALITLAREAGCERIRLTTDAGALSSPANARGVLDAGVRQIEVVLTGDQETHDRITGRPGLHAAAVAGARAFREVADAAGAHVMVTGRVPVCRHNASAAAFAVADLARAGALAVRVAVATTRAADRPGIEAALETAAANGLAAFVTGVDLELPRPQETAPWRLVEVVS